MTTTILKGTIVSAPVFGQLEILEGGYLVAENGIIRGTYRELPETYAHHRVQDWGNNLILQSFSDMHLHAPQYPMLGMGMDLPLIQWLNTYTFPTEAKFRDEGYAREIYHRLAKELVSEGTTRVCMFASLHRPATRILMEELEKAGISGFVGKVNMDRNGGVDLQEGTEESLNETIKWLEESDFSHIKPILTPRFTPSCTNELMASLGKLAKERDLPIQSHLSENTGEIAWVKELHPDCEEYWETYAKYGLWNDKTVMAHCVWSSERERKAMKDAGVWVAHCPASNQNIISGVAPVRQMLQEGLRVTLGSDIAGGDHISMFEVTADAIRTSKTRKILDGFTTDFLTVAEGYYLATSAAAPFFGEKPGFAPGNPFSAIVLSDDQLPGMGTLTARERFERCVYRRQKGAIRAVWGAGRQIYSAE